MDKLHTRITNWVSTTVTGGSLHTFTIKVKESLDLQLDGIDPNKISRQSAEEVALLIIPHTIRFELCRFHLSRLLPRMSGKHETGCNSRGSIRVRRGLSDVQYNPTTYDTVRDSNQGWTEPAVRKLGMTLIEYQVIFLRLCGRLAYRCESQDKDHEKADNFIGVG